MKKYTALSIAIILMIACSANSTTAQEKDDIYRHYKGTIGKDTVTLDLIFGFNGGSNYGGSTYFLKSSDTKVQLLIEQPPSTDKHQMLYGEESVTGNLFERNKGPRWEFRMSDNKLIGKWYSVDKTIEKNIELKEDYSHSYPFEVFINRAGKIHITPSVKTIKADNFFLSTRPAATTRQSDAAFIMEKINNIPIQYLNSFLKNKPESEELLLIFLMPVYNDQGILTMKMQYGYGQYAPNEAYLCLDVEQKRMLVYDDIMENDPELLSEILGKAYSKLKGTNAANVTNGISPTKNVMVTYNGIIFHYNSNQIAGVEYLSIYVPYSEMGSLLKKDFKKRMGL